MVQEWPQEWPGCGLWPRRGEENTHTHTRTRTHTHTHARISNSSSGITIAIATTGITAAGEAAHTDAQTNHQAITAVAATTTITAIIIVADGSSS